MTSHKNLDVRRVKSSLVATFARANPPLIWRFDLERNHSFTLALQGEDQEWELGVTSPKGEFQPVARFPLREDAEEAFAEISAVLAEGRCGGRWMGFLKTLGLILLATFLLLLVMSVINRSAAPVAPERLGMQESAPMPVLPPPATPPATNGVPLPADEALKPPP